MAGYKQGKYGHAALHDMVDTHFLQLQTKLKLYGLSKEFKEELSYLTRIYQPFLNCKCREEKIHG